MVALKRYQHCTTHLGLMLNTLSITFKRKLNCSSEELQSKFDKAFPVTNGMARILRLSHENLVLKSQTELWQEFIKTRDMECPVCDCVRIMPATPPNSALVELACSKLEQLCQNRCNQIGVNHLKDQFFLGLLNLPIKECMDYEKEQEGG